MDRTISDDQFLEFRCPNRPGYPNRSGGEYDECKKELGGPSMTTVAAALAKGMYQDVRYCSSCKALWMITIDSEDDPPHWELLPKEARVDFVKDVDLFGLVEVSGNRTKGGS